MVNITEIHMSAAVPAHEHIASVRWRVSSSGETGQSTRAQMVDWIEGGGVARVRDSAGNEIAVGVVKATPHYIRTYADGVWTDNLLSLPRY
jgi:hypothetical protein